MVYSFITTHFFNYNQTWSIWEEHFVRNTYDREKYLQDHGEEILTKTETHVYRLASTWCHSGVLPGRELWCSRYLHGHPERPHRMAATLRCNSAAHEQTRAVVCVRITLLSSQPSFSLFFIWPQHILLFTNSIKMNLRWRVWFMRDSFPIFCSFPFPHFSVVSMFFSLKCVFCT